MAAATPELETFAKRLEKVEKENNWLRLALALVAILSLASTWAGFLRKTESLNVPNVETNYFVLRHEDGVFAAEMNARLQDELTVTIGRQDHAHAKLITTKGGVGFNLYDESRYKKKPSGEYNTKPRASMTAHNNGPTSLAFHDTNGILRMLISLGEKGPRLDFYDEAGRSRAALGFEHDHAFLLSWDTAGKSTTTLIR